MHLTTARRRLARQTRKIRVTRASCTRSSLNGRNLVAIDRCRPLRLLEDCAEDGATRGSSLRDRDRHPLHVRVLA